MKLKRLMCLVFLVLFLATSIPSIAVTSPSTPIPVVYEITTYGTKPENCSVVFINSKNNYTLDASCSSCYCMEDMANIGSVKGDIIHSTVCIYNGSICREDVFRIDTEIIEKTFEVRNCIPDYSVILDVTSFTNDSLNVKSETQDLRDLKEYEILKLNSIKVIKRNECDPLGWAIAFNLLKPTGQNDNPFGISKISLPKLSKNQVYELDFDKKGIEKLGDTYFLLSYYVPKIDDKGYGEIIKYRGMQELSIKGLWSITAWLIRDQFSDFFIDSEHKFTVYLTNGNYQRTTSFNVVDKTDIIMRKNAEESLKQQIIGNNSAIFANFVTMGLGLAAIFVSLYVFKAELKHKKNYDEKQQRDLLKSIETELRVIDRDIVKNEQDLNKEPPIVPPEIHLLDSSSYTSSISHEINGHSIEDLKELILEIGSEISAINLKLRLAQEHKSLEGTTNNPYIKQIKQDNYTCHIYLKELMKRLREEIREVLYFNKHKKKE